jgi:ABC-type transport system involved in multi-copper enzyme maturation permease subunit
MNFAGLLRRSAVQSRYVLLGGALILPLFQFLLIGQAAEIERSQAFGRMAEFVPAFLQRGLGQQALLLATFKGTVSFGYFHPVIVCLLSVIAIYVATEPAYEVERGLVDLVLARSVPRSRLITRSVLLSMSAVAALAFLMLCGTFLGLRWLAADASSVPSPVILRLAVNLVAVAWCCGAIGLFLATLSRRWGTAFTSGALIVVVGYLVDFLALGWPPARTLAWFFPFQYFPALLIIGGTASPWRDLAVLFSATAVFVALSYWRFNRRDL